MGRHSMCVDGDGRQKLCGLTLMPYDSDHLTAAAAPLSSLQNTCIQRCCLLLMSVGADLSSGDLLWKFKLHFGAIFFFVEWLLRMLKAISNENVKQISVLQSSSGGHQPWLKMILFFFGLGSVLAQTWLSSFCSWDQVVILKRFLLCLLQVLVMQWWSFCDFSVLLLYLPSADSGRGLVALDKEAWLTQSCVGVLCRIAYFIHSFGSSSLPAFQ